MKFLNYIPALVLFLLAHQITAQNRWGAEFSFQTQSTRLGDYYVLTDPVNGDFSYTRLKKSINLKPEAGVTLRYYLNYTMAIGLGIFYSGHGQNYREYSVNTSSGFYFSDYSWDHAARLGYLKIPLTFQYESLPFKSASFFANAGVYLGFLTGYTDRDEAFIFNPEVYSTYDATYTDDGITVISDAFDQYNGHFLSQAYRSRDWGLNLAAGINLKISDKLWFPISIQYQLGLADVKNHASLYVLNTPDSNAALYWVENTGEQQRRISHARNRSEICF
ncbi:MAG: outer membrane beta-barrel protein [Bacteroidota bacterium]